MIVEKTKEPLKMPALFKAIIDNEAALRITKASAVVCISAYRQQRDDKRAFMKSAEKIYAGTKNKGTEI